MNKATAKKTNENTLLVWVENFGAIYQMVLEDVVQVFSRYGQVGTVELIYERSYAVVHFTDVAAAEKAVKELSGRTLRGASGVLCVRLLSSSCMLKSGNSEVSSKHKIVKKYTARYEVQIDPNNGFEVAKRIIGLKGTNMKLIHSNTNSKLRLRGRGSGYLEGLHRKEAPEPLHLCVSCQYHSNYVSARCLVEKLLSKIYGEYDMWLKQCGKVPLQLKPKPYEVLIHFPPDSRNQRLISPQVNSSNSKDRLVTDGSAEAESSTSFIKLEETVLRKRNSATKILPKQRLSPSQVATALEEKKISLNPAEMKCWSPDENNSCSVNNTSTQSSFECCTAHAITNLIPASSHSSTESGKNMISDEDTERDGSAAMQNSGLRELPEEKASKNVNRGILDSQTSNNYHKYYISSLSQSLLKEKGFIQSEKNFF